MGRVGHLHGPCDDGGTARRRCDYPVAGLALDFPAQSARMRRARVVRVTLDSRVAQSRTRSARCRRQHSVRSCARARHLGVDRGAARRTRELDNGREARGMRPAVWGIRPRATFAGACDGRSCAVPPATLCRRRARDVRVRRLRAGDDDVFAALPAERVRSVGGDGRRRHAAVRAGDGARAVHRRDAREAFAGHGVAVGRAVADRGRQSVDGAGRRRRTLCAGGARHGRDRAGGRDDEWRYAKGHHGVRAA